MAKSLRSKRRRKMRAIKRVRYGAKELEKLKQILGVDKTLKTEEVDISDIAEVKTAEEIRQENAEDDVMEVENGPSKFNARTLRDKNGAYPVWLHPRKIPRKSKKLKKKIKKTKTKGKN